MQRSHGARRKRRRREAGETSSPYEPTPSPRSARGRSTERLPASWRAPADASRTAWSAKSCGRLSRLTGACRGSGLAKR